jgi:hypothetical protein
MENGFREISSGALPSALSILIIGESGMRFWNPREDGRKNIFFREGVGLSAKGKGGFSCTAILKIAIFVGAGAKNFPPIPLLAHSGWSASAIAFTAALNFT